MKYFLTVCCCLIWLTVCSAIISKGGDNKITEKSSEDTKKADQIDAQSSHTHSIYEGFGDNGLGGGLGSYGGSGISSFGGGDGFDTYGSHHRIHDHHHHDHDHHYHEHGHGGSHHDDGGYHKALAIKGLLVPLAGVALLGAAAAFVTNPILLQLGVISGTYGRRKREVGQAVQQLNEAAARLDAQNKLNEIHILEKFMAQVPKEQVFSQEKKLMASYLSCSGGAENACLERLACELHGPGANKMPEETHVMSIVTNEIFNNDLVPMKTKQQMAEAVQIGREGGDCSIYSCSDLETLISKNN